MDNATDIDDAAFLKMVAPNTGAITVLDEADIDSFGSGTFTLDYPTADATARYFGYVSFADPVAAGGQPTAKRFGGVKHALSGHSYGVF